MFPLVGDAVIDVLRRGTFRADRCSRERSEQCCNGAKPQIPAWDCFSTRPARNVLGGRKGRGVGGGAGRFPSASSMIAQRSP